MNRFYNRFLFSLITFCIGTSVVLAEHFRHINLSDGLSQPSVMSINQDPLGRMWFGTREGINIYDRAGIISYKGWVKNTYDGEELWIGNEVSSIVNDSAGMVHLHIDRDVISYDIYTDRFTKATNTRSVTALASYRGDIAYVSNDSVFVKKSGAQRAAFQFTIPGAPVVNHMEVTDKQFILSTRTGLYAYDKDTHRQSSYLKGTYVYSTFTSRDGTLWISTLNNGLYRLGKNDTEPVLVSIPEAPKNLIGAQQTRYAVEDQYGRIWYGAFYGLYCYDPHTATTQRIQITSHLGGLSHPSIYGMFRDRQDNIWVGSYYGGVNYFSPNHDRYFNFDYDRVAPTNFYHSFVIDFVTDRHGNLWFATDGGGVCCVDSTWNIVDHLSTRGHDKALRQNNIKSMAYDPKSDRVFIGTHLGGLSYYDIATRRTVNFIDNPEKNSSGDVIRHIKVRGDNLFISSRLGMHRLAIGSNDFFKLSDNTSIQFDFDDHGNLYFIAGSGLFKIPNATTTENPQTIELAKRIYEPTCIAVTDSVVCIGTLGHGVHAIPLDTAATAHLYSTVNSGLPSDYCYAVVKGSGSDVYITTDGKVVKFNLHDKSVKSLDFHDYFPDSHIISECGLMMRPDSSLLIGSTKGITVLNKENFTDFDSPGSDTPDFYFSALNVIGQDIMPYDGSGILPCAIPFADKINLRHDQSSFTLRIASSDYAENSERFHYIYRLDGIDKEWLPAVDGTIHYTNLAPGSYTLRVRGGADPTGPDAREIKLGVKVSSPWYATWWAFLIYFIVGSAIAYFVWIKARDVIRLRYSLRDEKMKREQIERLNHEKLVFFTNVTHEFQTPLTLIMSHIDLLLPKAVRNERLASTLKRMRAHVEQMSHLITQLLEFRKLQQNHLTLHIGRHNASEMLEKTAEAFAEYADKRGIDFSVDIPDDPVIGYFDPRLIDRVFVNIISNAFKYTPDGGCITLTLGYDAKGNIVFECSDTGIGISDKDLPFIFDRFYNGSADEAKYNDLHYKTTGIGLAFAKSIIESHHGDIRVESRIKEGSKFVVCIPGSAQAYEGDDNVVFDNGAYQHEPDAIPPQTLPASPSLAPEVEDESAENASDPERPTLLVVEDNFELRSNLSAFFSAYYNVITATDGLDGLEKAKQCNPDIIISDVLMPGMDGTEMCRKIKSDPALCHIPVILLTALSATESQVAGLNANADDYVTKPYDSTVLLARVDNLLRSRSMLHSKLDGKPASEIDVTVVNPNDRDLLKRTSQIIEEHMADPSLDIPFLCSELAVSRSLFYNKFKTLTGMTPNAFILSHRLKHAAALLTTQPHLSITEVADQTGFNTTVYFGRCFKKQFGISPQKYRATQTDTPKTT